MKFKLQLIFFLFPFIAHAMQQPFPPLIAAAHAGNLELVRTLVGQGADVNQVDSVHNGNALHWAVRYKHEAVALYLITKTNININAKEHAGHTAIHYSSGDDLPNVTTALLNHPQCDMTIIPTNHVYSILYHEASAKDFSIVRIIKILQSLSPEFRHKKASELIQQLKEQANRQLEGVKELAPAFEEILEKHKIA